MIRRLAARDASEWHALRLRGLRAHPDAFTSTWARERKDGPPHVRARLRENVVLGAFVRGALAATLAFHRETNPKTRHRAYIWGVYVAPEHRGLGLGRDLLAEALRRLRATRGVDLVRLDVGTWNAGARKLYRSVGFRAFGVDRSALRLGRRRVDEEMMVCFLGKRR